MKASPGLIAPRPTAPTAASPPPAATTASRGSPSASATSGLQRRDRVGPFDQRRENRRGDAGRRERLRRTSAAAPRRASHVPAASLMSVQLFAGQRQTQIVLGQQHAGDARVGFGLMAAKPHQLRRGEARHRLHAGDGGEAGAPLAELARLGEGASVVVQDRRPQRAVVGAERHRAVHLSGKADRGDRAEHLRRFALEIADGGEHRFAPHLGVLLGPQRMRMIRLIGAGGGGDDDAVVDQRGFEGGRAAIDAESDHCATVAEIATLDKRTRRRGQLGRRPCALVLRRREAASKDSPAQTNVGDPWIILRRALAHARAAPDERTSLVKASRHSLQPPLRAAQIAQAGGMSSAASAAAIRPAARPLARM